MNLKMSNILYDATNRQQPSVSQVRLRESESMFSYLIFWLIPKKKLAIFILSAVIHNPNLGRISALL